MRRFLSWMDKNLESTFLGITMTMMFLVLFLQTALRYLFNAAWQWPEEFSRFVFIWFVFIGMSYCVRYHSHLSVVFLTAFFPKISGFYEIIADVSVLLFSGVMSYAGAVKLKSLAASNQLSPAMQIPMVFFYLALEAGFVLCFIRAVQSLILRGARKNSDGGEAVR